MSQRYQRNTVDSTITDRHGSNRFYFYHTDAQAISAEDYRDYI